jgi:urease subunit alpha
MFASFGRAMTASAVTFVSQAALDNDIGGDLGLSRSLLPVVNTRGGISKASMQFNDYCPDIDVNPETYEVRADGELLTCEPLEVVSMAQRYFLF